MRDSLLAVEAPGLDVLGGSVIGIVLVLSLLGWIWFKPSVDRLLADKEKAEGQRDALVLIYEEKVIPILGDVQGKVVPALESLKQSVDGYERTQKAVADNLLRLTQEVARFGSV